MHPRAEELIRELRLLPHQEGGHFAEEFRSPRRVWTADAGGAPGPARSALTTIYFLLAAGEVSRWHRLDADEAWHFYEGAPLDLFLLDADALILTRTRLGPVEPNSLPVHVVPAGSWLAARPVGDFTFVGCTVGPGFEPEGLAFMKDVPAVAVDVARRFPEVTALL